MGAKRKIVGLIPAAGSGTRLYPFARAVPKEMYPILGKAVIEHCVDNLKAGGIEKIFMVVGYQKGALMDYIGDGSFFGVNAAYIYQMKRKGLGHAIYQGKEWIDTTFVTLLGDSFIEPKNEIKLLIDVHVKKKPIATLLLFKVSDPAGYGLAKLGKISDSCGMVEKVVEKPPIEKAAGYKTGDGYYAMCGGYVFEPGIFDYIEKTKPGAKGEIQITDAISLAIKSGEKVCGVILKGKYIDIGKWKTILHTERELLRYLDIDMHVKEREAMMEKMKLHDEEGNGR
jgi:UDP-N-acetylglucosamine diphosphorylase / glucose-1-phosphate thymidylyltransferase / UDP-N-acetylgalactosamine diphosphorylase / glucosamine-1-phosphate N-acetyltransferase / galactosamine-1-phosphate N-acetyltransferase